MNCPNCGHDEWKSASFVYKSGYSTIDTSTKSVGAGVGAGGGAIGAAGSKTTGFQQTLLSADVSPPEKPSNYGVTVYWALTIIFMVWAAGVAEPLGLVVLIGAIYIWFTNVRYKVKADFESRLMDYHQQMELWEQSRVCQRCGNVYAPAESQLARTDEDGDANFT